MGIVIMALFLSLTTGEFSSSVSMAKADLQAKVRLAMDWIVKDIRQTYPSQIDSNDPTVSHIKFKKVTGIVDATGEDYTVTSDYTEYNYTSALNQLTRNEVDDSGKITRSWNFTNITQASFYTAPGQSLAPGGILTSRKLIVVITGQSQVRNSLILNQTLTEEVKIRND